MLESAVQHGWAPQGPSIRSMSIFKETSHATIQPPSSDVIPITGLREPYKHCLKHPPLWLQRRSGSTVGNGSGDCSWHTFMPHVAKRSTGILPTAPLREASATQCLGSLSACWALAQVRLSTQPVDEMLTRNTTRVLLNPRGLFPPKVMNPSEVRVSLEIAHLQNGVLKGLARKADFD